MFETITIREQNRRNQESPIDPGFLVECLIFYRRVTVTGHQGVLKQLFRILGPHHFYALLQRGSLEFLYEDDFLAIHTHTDPIGFKTYNLIQFTSPELVLDRKLWEIAIELTGKQGQGRRAAQRLAPLIHSVKTDASVHKSIQTLFANPVFLDSAVRTTLAHLVPEFPSTQPFQFGLRKTEKGYVLNCDLPFDRLNQYYHQRVPASDSTIDPAFLLSHIAEGETHAFFAARQSSELATDPLGADLCSHRVLYLAHRAKKSELARAAFTTLAFTEARSIREAFNRGALTIDEVMPIIEKADKFKDWLNRRDVDEDLIKTYYREVAKESVIDQLPAKTTRWALFTGAGIAVDAAIPTGLGTAAGVGLSVLDSFFLDRLLKGWKPNQFIEEHLAPVLRNVDQKAS